MMKLPDYCLTEKEWKALEVTEEISENITAAITYLSFIYL